MCMPFGIRQQIEQIRAYAAVTAKVADGGSSKELVMLMRGTADELEVVSRFIFNALGPNLDPPERATYKPFRHRY